MNASISLESFKPSVLLPLLKQYASKIVFLAVMAMVAYTGYQISQATAVGPDQAYLSQKQQKQKTINLKSNKKTLEQLRALQPSGDTSIPAASGKHNPFTLN